MNDREKWNQQIADGAKVAELLQDDGRVNGREVFNDYYNSRMTKAMESVFVGLGEPVDYESYRNAFYEFKANANALTFLTQVAPKNAEVARNKLNELDTIESATQF